MKHTVITNKYGTVWYYKEDTNTLNNEGDPATELVNDDKQWYQGVKLHREDGPAVEYRNGDKSWWQHNKLHRLDGPAIEYADGRKEYFIDDKKYSKEDFDNLSYKDKI